MANLLDRFNKEVVGSEGKIADYSSTISSTGDFTRNKDIQTIISSWQNILLTPTRSYIEDPEYGCDLYKMIYEPADTVTEDKIRAEIEDKLQFYDDRAYITNIDITFLSNQKGFSVSVFVEYKGDKSQLNIIIDENLYLKFMENSP
jgi:phage baseplate assembly protein W